MHGSKNEVIKKLSEVLIVCKNKIAPAFFKSLTDSIEKRGDAVIKAKRWHIKY